MGWLGLLRVWQPLVTLKEWGDRCETFAAARAVADRLGKPLLNVGCPATNPMRHDCGDVCLDLDPSRLVACTARRAIKADVRSIPFPDKSFGAATCFHVLEHLPTVADAEQALRELHRVADYVFVLSPTRLSPTNWLNPGHTIWPIHRDDGTIRFEQRHRQDEPLYPVLSACWGAFERAVWSARTGRPPGAFGAPPSPPAWPPRSPGGGPTDAG